MRSLCILVVEDHEESLLALARLLRLDGYPVHLARSAGEARALAAAKACDVAICDLGLPDGRGTDLIRELRASHGLRSIALTGFTTAEDERDVKSAGFDAYLKKPVHYQDLLRVLSQVTGDGDRAGG